MPEYVASITQNLRFIGDDVAMWVNNYNSQQPLRTPGGAGCLRDPAPIAACPLVTALSPAYRSLLHSLEPGLSGTAGRFFVFCFFIGTQDRT